MGRTSRLELVLDCAEPQELQEFWRAALRYRTFHSSRELVVLVPDNDRDASPLLLQRVPEPKVGKNRMHVDLIAADVTPEVDRLLALGATRAHDGVQRLGPVAWVTLLDPAGNEFCVSTGIEW